MPFPERLRSAALAALFLATLTLPGLAAVTPRRSPAMTALRLPLRFEQNQGQTAAPVRYLARGRGYTLFLTPSEAVLSLRPGKKASSTSDVIRMHLVKGSQTPRMEALDALPGESNYLIGRNPKDWRRDVPGYGRVAERGVYPGIDLIYYGNQQQLEYDFVVAPNADPSRIALQMAGASHVTIDRDGNLVLSNHDGSVTLRRPTIYQMENGHRIPVNGQFVRKGKDKVAFHLGAYDHQKQLVIDPVLEYSSYLGGSGNEIGEGIAVDSQGYIYIAGSTGSVDFPVKGGVQSSCGGSCKPSMSGYADAFITKIDPKGPSLVYSTYLGGSSPDQANGIAIDANGDAYVAGVTFSADFPLQNAYQSTCGPCATVGSNAFITELNPAGSGLIFSTYLGSSGTSCAQAIALDANNGVYVAGSSGSAFPVTTGAFGTNCGGNGAFVSKLQPGGAALAYSGCIGTSPTQLNGLAVDSNGAAYIVGQTQPSSYTTTSGAFQTSGNNGAGGSTGFFDGFVTKIDPTGTKLDYSTFLGGTEDDRIYGIAVDAGGDAYVTGYTTSPDFPVVNALQSKCGGCSQNQYSNAFVSELNPTGSGLVFSTYLGGSGGDAGGRIAVDSAGNVFVAGTAYSSNFPFVNAFQAKSPYGGQFVSELSSGGAALRYATPLGSGGTVLGIAVDGSDFVYLTGQSSAGWPTTSNALQSTVGGTMNYSDAFVTILSDSILQATPTELTFPDQAIGTASAPQQVTLTANGHGPVPSLRFGISRSGSGDIGYSEISNCPTILDAGQSCAVQVTFKPGSSGPYPGALQIYSSASQYPQPVSLSGTGIGPTATILPTTLTFPTQPAPGHVSNPQTVTLHNAGPGPLTITGVSVTKNFVETNTCGSSLTEGGDCTFNVTFVPETSGTLSGTLSVSDDSSNSPQSVSLSGTGVSAIAKLSPSTLTFATQTIGTTSAAQTVTLSNDSSATVPLSIFEIYTGDFFSETNNCGTSLAIGASCQIQVTFAPTVDGIQSGTLVIYDNSGSGSQSVLLNGTGTGPVVELNPSQISFGQSQFVGTTSAPAVVTLKNTGNAALNIAGFKTTSDFAIVGNTCGATLAPGATCQIPVVFKPTGPGQRTGTLTVSDDAAGGTQSVSLVAWCDAPVPTFSPASLTFPGQRVGTGSAPQLITLTNLVPWTSDDLAVLQISGISTTGDFVQSNTCGSALKELESCIISVSFAPTAAGTRTGTITISDNLPDSPQTLSLSGVGTAPGAVLAPASLDFGTQPVWTAGAAQTVTLSNNGTAPLTVTSIDAGGDFLETNNCPGSLAAGAVCTISVAFRPVSAGADKEVLTVYDDAGSSPQQVALAGTGTAPVTTISVPALAFGSQTVGSASPAQTIALSNTGTDVLQIGGIGASGDFTESNTCSDQLAAGAQCSISVQFAPAAAGDRTGSLVINDSTGGATIALAGTGTQPGAVLTPSVLAFGSAAMGTASPAQTVTLTNSGSAPLAISGITASTDFQQTSTCGSSLDAGASCIINVQFAPSAAGARAGTVTVADGLGTQVVAVSGIGNSPQISLDPATLTFGSYRKGSTSPAQTVTLTNSGSAPLVITGVAAEGDFSATNDCGTSLAAGAHCSLNVFFTPTARGQRTGALLIETASETAVVTLSGSGSYTGVRLSPAEVHFGSQPVGTASPAQTVTVTNTGTGVLTIRAITASGDYQQTNTCGTLPAQVPAGGVCSLSITVTPTTPGRITGSIQLATSAGMVQVGAAHRARAAASDSADVGSETDVIALSAAGGSSDLTVSPSSLAFGSQTVGAASAAQAVTVTNQGSGALTLNPLQISGNFAEKDTCTGTLAAGATCSVEVTMTPTAAGAQTGLLTVSAGSSTAAVALSGSGAAPGLSVSPSMMTFDKQQVGTASAAQTITLTNQGSTDLTLTLQTGSDFSLGSSCPALAAGATCQIPVTFKPTAAGNRTGVLSATADGGQSVEVALSGTGTAPAVTLSAATLDFSHQPVGIASAAQTVTVTNSGTAPLTISGITANGDFAAASQCGASLDAGASCTVQVTFKPAQVGSRTGTLQISDDAAGSPSTVALSGSGSDFTLTTPQAASLSAGQSAQFALILQNQGADAENLTLSCSGAPAGGTCQVSPGTVTLGSDPATVTVSVTTAGRALALPVPSSPPAGMQRLWGLGLMGFVLLLVGWQWIPQTRRGRLPVAAALAGLALLVLLAGCGGGPSPSGSGGTGGTPSGSYTLTLKATAASGLSHTVSWKVNVE